MSRKLDSIGGDNRDRTGDLLLAKQALSQLSYIPVPKKHDRALFLVSLLWSKLRGLLDLVGLGRVELPTSRLSGVRSNHLSYRPKSKSRSRSEWNEPPRYTTTVGRGLLSEGRGL